MKIKCDNCKGTGVIDPCPHCKGSGEIEHDCGTSRSLETIATLYKLSYEFLEICRCRVCSQLWKVHFQYDPGTGPDYIWMKPGERKRDYEFSTEEAELIDRILKATTISELPQGWIGYEKHIRELVIKRMRELQNA